MSNVAEAHAKEWMRCILNAGGEENVAQQAVALAALNGLFEPHHEAEHLRAALRLHDDIAREEEKSGDDLMWSERLREACDATRRALGGEKI